MKIAALTFVSFCLILAAADAAPVRDDGKPVAGPTLADELAEAVPPPFSAPGVAAVQLARASLSSSFAKGEGTATYRVEYRKRRGDDEPRGRVNVALLYVGHGEPAHAEDGDVPITHADGTPFGPHAVDLGVPPDMQYTEWAAAFEEIATAMTYIFDDLNGNGIPHEVAMVPAGDVPGFFNWPAFHASVYEHYEATGNYSPHNDALRRHVMSLDVEVFGAKVDIHLAYLDAVPRIRDVVYEIVRANKYDELVVVPMLLANSTHTEEVHELVADAAELDENLEIVVGEPFFEVPFMQRRFRDAVVSMVRSLRSAIPQEIADHNIGVLLASHGSPYVPPFPEYGWQEGEIFSELIPTEDVFHHQIAQRLPWLVRTGRMNYSLPTIEQTIDSFDADGFTHVMVVPSAFPTAAIHTMWDVANAAVERAVLPEEGIVTHTRPSGMKVYYTSMGLADLRGGRREFRKGLEHAGRIGVMEALAERGSVEHEEPVYVACEPDMLCVTVTADDITGSQLQVMLYETTEADWPESILDLPLPNWVVMPAMPFPDRLPARLRIPIPDSLAALGGGTLEGARLGLAIATSDGPDVEADDARGFSLDTAVYHEGNDLDFGKVNVALPQPGEICLPGEICVTITNVEPTGPDLKLMLYQTTEEGWPYQFITLPTPDWVITETRPVPDSFPLHIRIPLAGNVFAISTDPIEGARVGLAVVTGVASTFIVEPTDARGFSGSTLVYDASGVMDFGQVEVLEPAGDICDLNPYHPDCLTGPMFWEERFLAPEQLVPGAIYMDMADVDGDGILDIIMVGEPHFEEPDLPLTVLKLGVYYLDANSEIRDWEILDQWTADDPMFYSPWGIRVINHSGAPMIIVGLNIPDLAPLEEGNGDILSYRMVDGTWVREVVRHNPMPTVENYNSMIVVPADIDNDGDEDLALSGAFGTSGVGSWMENTGNPAAPWIPHLLPITPGTDPAIRGTLAYKSADLNGDNYPEVVYNAMFDIPGTEPPRYRGEIWLAINPGPTGWGDLWPTVVIDNDNWASADMWFHDFDGDSNLDLVANQIFDSTVTLYHHPGANLFDPWVPEVIIDDLTSPSDMWLADMDYDGLMDVVSADHTAHRGVWHRNPGPGGAVPWQQKNVIFNGIRLPGDFVMVDLEGDGDQDYVGTTLTLGQAFIVEQVHPPRSLVTTISLPDGFSGNINQLMVALASNLPLTGPPDAVLATISNADADGNGVGDVDQILNASRDLVLGFEDVGPTGAYHLVVVLFMEGGGIFQPVPGVDYMAASGPLTFGGGTVETELELQIVGPMVQ
jgi:protoheme ferro-lyase